MASFLGPGWLQTLSAIGNVGKGYNEGQDSAVRRAMLTQQIQEQQRKQQMEQQLAAALFSGGGQRLAPTNQGPQLPGGGGQMPPMGGGGTPPQQQQQGPDPSALAALGQIMGGGGGGMQAGPGPQSMGDGMMGQIPGRGTPGRQGLVDLLIRDESGGRNVNQGIVPAGGGYNPSVGRVTGPSSASGYGQMIDSTFRATPTAQRTGYVRAIDAPRDIQESAINDRIDQRGLKDWAPYNKKFKADSDAFLKGLDLSPEFYKPAQTAANQITNSTPIGAMGTLTLDSLVEQINQRMPDASPQVKLAAMQFLSPLMEKQAAHEWDVTKWKVTQQEHQREFDLRREDTKAQREATAAYRQDNIDLRRDQIEASGRQKDETGWTLYQPEDKTKPPQWIKPGEQPRDAGVGAGTKAGTGTGIRGGVAGQIMDQYKRDFQTKYGKPPDAEDLLRFQNKAVAQQSIERAYGSGIMGRNMVSLNTLADHIETIEDYAAALRNGDIPRLNQLANIIAREAGKPEVTNAQAAQAVVGDELARLMTMTGGTEGDRVQMQKAIFDPNASPEQQQGGFNVMRRLVKGRLVANEQQYARNDPERRKTFQEEMLTPGSRKVFLSEVPVAAEPQGRPQASPPSGAQPGGQYNTIEDVAKAVDAGALPEAEAKKIMIEKFGYTAQ